MRAAHALKYLSLPVAAGLVVAMVVACSDGLTTGPKRLPLSPPLLSISVEDDTGGECPNGFKAETVTAGTGSDTNANGIICTKGDSGGGGKKKPPKK